MSVSVNKRVKMIRKTILMPPDLVKKMEGIAIKKIESFAAIMRESA